MNKEPSSDVSSSWCIIVYCGTYLSIKFYLEKEISYVIYLLEESLILMLTYSLFCRSLLKAQEGGTASIQHPSSLGLLERDRSKYVGEEDLRFRDMYKAPPGQAWVACYSILKPMCVREISFLVHSILLILFNEKVLPLCQSWATLQNLLGISCITLYCNPIGPHFFL